jgi:hypothetical protein
LFIVLVIKYGSAALLWIILTLRLPLVQIAFAISFINDPPDPFKVSRAGQTGAARSRRTSSYTDHQSSDDVSSCVVSVPSQITYDHRSVRDLGWSGALSVQQRRGHNGEGAGGA